MPTITKSVRASGGDYTTVPLLEADLDDSGVFSTGDDVVGELYNEVYTEVGTINGGGTLILNSITIKAAAGEEHDGTAGSGARIVADSNGSKCICASSVVTRIEALEFDFNGYTGDSVGSIKSDSTTANGVVFQRLIVHGGDTSSTTIRGIGNNNGNMHVLNCIVYDFRTTTTGGGDCHGISSAGGGSSRVFEFHNNTVWGMVNDNGSGDARGLILHLNDTGYRGDNNIAMNSGGTASGSIQAFVFGGTNVAADYNMSDDATADDAGGLNCLISESTSGVFVNTSAGTEDFHLVFGSNAIDAGTDKVTTPTGVEIDIDGRDRDANSDTWDIGAHEYVGGGGGGTNPKGALGHPVTGALGGPI